MDERRWEAPPDPAAGELQQSWADLPEHLKWFLGVLSKALGVPSCVPARPAVTLLLIPFMLWETKVVHILGAAEPCGSVDLQLCEVLTGWASWPSAASTTPRCCTTRSACVP